MSRASREPLDALEDALIDLESTTAVIDAVSFDLDGETRARCADTMARHLSNDVAALRRAFDRAYHAKPAPSRARVKGSD